ncbi:MAG: SMC-Scp complex subunit ScpB [Methylocystaceae bacterium]
MLNDDIKAAIEAILFARGLPVLVEDLVRVLQLDEERLGEILTTMEAEYSESRYGIRLLITNEGVTLCSKKEYSDLIAALDQQPVRRLSRAALETLAIIAYRQPVTRGQVEMLRGVKVERAIYSLLERGLIREIGRGDTVGKPLIYGTSEEFLRLFGLTSLDELPPLAVKEIIDGAGEVAGGTD